MQPAIQEQQWQKLQYLALARSGSLLAATPPEVSPAQTSVDDGQLMQRIATREREAFSQLYDRYATVLYSMALRILTDAEEAADVLQEAFLQVWEKSSSYNPALGKPFSWVLALTRNRAIDRLRARKRQYRFVENAAQEVTNHKNSHQESISHDEAMHIRSAIATLPLEQRQAIEMAFFGGLTQQEISQALSQPLGTIKARI